MKSVVIGGLGFLGGAIVRDLLARGDDVTTIDHRIPDPAWDEPVPGVHALVADIRDLDEMRTALDGAQEVFHLAGLLGTSELEAQLAASVQTNILGSLNVFEAAVQAGVERLFLACKPNVWLNAYSISKYAAEQYAQIYDRDRDISIRCLRYFNGFGPRQHLTPVRKLLPAFAALAMTGRPLEIYGDGEQAVDLIYTPDLARVTVDYTRSGAAGPEAVDLGRGRSITVNEVAGLVADYFGLGADHVVHAPMRLGEIPGTTLLADITAVEATIGPLRLTDLDRSIHETLDWYSSRPSAELEAAAASYEVAACV